MIGHLYTLLFVGEAPTEAEAPRKSARGGSKRRVSVQKTDFQEHHARHGNEAAIRFVIALAISGEE
jgi:hypothetical protein